jgi:hypothetical protein
LSISSGKLTPQPTGQRALQVRCERDQLLLGELLLQQHLPVIAKCHQVKGRLAKINAYRTNLHVDDPP